LKLVKSFVFILFLFASCKKSVSTGSSKITDTIYVGGIINDSAVYWENGKVVVLAIESSGFHDEVNSIFISGSDVYVVGGLKDSCVYWKNQVPVLLSPDLNVTFNGPNTEWGSTSIFVSGSDVYTTIDGGYIKNGIATILETGGPNGAQSDANAIFAIDEDVYVGGSKFDAGSGPENSTAVYWRNGVPVTLDSGIHYGYIKSIYVNGSDVYAAGNYTDLAAGYGQPSQAVYWKNGIAHILDSNEFSCATSMAISGDDVYVGGYIAPAGSGGGSGTPVYWKNGIMTQLTGDAIYYVVNSIFIKGSDVYVAGYEFLSSGQIAVYWKNGIETKLPSSGSTSYATSIFVK
jgi:hypothetical protein